MTKAIKKKSKTLKVKPTKRVSEAKLRELGDQALAEFQEASQDRYDRAMVIYEAQDNETKDALDRMIDLLSGIARKRMWVGAGRHSDSRLVMTLPDQVIRHNMTYMAVEILKDLAQMDVRVASFKFPKDLCIVCNRPTKKKKVK